MRWNWWCSPGRCCSGVSRHRLRSRPRRRTPVDALSGRKATAAAIIAVVVIQTALVALLIARHPPIYGWYDHRLWYYPLPFQALVTALLVVLIRRAVPAWSSARTGILCLLLATMVIGNVVRWKDYRRAQLRSSGSLVFTH